MGSSFNLKGWGRNLSLNAEYLQEYRPVVAVISQIWSMEQDNNDSGTAIEPLPHCTRDPASILTMGAWLNAVCRFSRDLRV